MENRKSLVLLLVVVAMSLLARESLAYKISAHRNLTRSTVSFFNEKFPQQAIDEDSLKLLLKGVTEEDNTPRYLYHFYDPVHNKGLTVGVKTWLSSKRWSRDKEKQLAVGRMLSLANLFSSSAAADVDFTWQKAISYYQEGNKEKAMEVLGHILHLLQDASVPAHTRNDIHLNTSPYENFSANKKVPKMSDGEVILLKNLDDYFDEMASYSNNNFYSRDTIGLSRQYKKPEPDYQILRDGYYYGIKNDRQGSYYLFRKSGSNPLLARRGDVTIDAPLVLQDYWNRLSVSAVQYGAGLLNLFYKEVAISDVDKKSSKKITARLPDRQARLPDRQARLPDRQASAGKTTLVGKIVKNDFGPSSSYLASAKILSTTRASSEITGNGELRSEQFTGVDSDSSPVRQLAKTKENVVNNQQEKINKLIIETEDLLNQTKLALADLENKSAPKEFDKVNGMGGIAPNLIGGVAVALPGSAGGGVDEEIDSGHLLGANSGMTGDSEFSDSTLESAGGGNASELIQEQGEDASAVVVSSSNDEEEGGTQDGGGVEILASQHLDSSTSTEIEGEIPDQYLGISTVTEQDSTFLADSSENLEKSDFQNVVISKFLFDAKGSDKGNEFIELCNLSDKEIDISGWSIQTGSIGEGRIQKKNFEKENKIRARSSFLIWLGENEIADMQWKSGSLKNSSSTIYLVDNKEKVTADNDKDIIDIATYDVDNISNFEAGDIVELASCLEASEKLPEFSLKSLSFYKNPLDQETSLIDIAFDDYPIVAGETDKWKVLVFYKDQEPVGKEWIDVSTNWEPEDLNGVIDISYPTYTTAPYTDKWNKWWQEEAGSKRHLLILPDVAEGYGNGGGIVNSAYNYDIIEMKDGIIRLRTEGRAEYLTVAIYDFWGSGGGSQRFKLKAIDKTKYFFQDEPPIYQPPVMEGSLNFDFDRDKSLLTIMWPKATDVDTLDSAIIYEIKINGELKTVAENSYQRRVAPGDQLAIEIRAKDEFNNYSEIKSADWSYPDFQLFITQEEAGDWSDPIGRKNPNCLSPCSASVSSQDLTVEEDFNFNFVDVRVKQNDDGWVADLRLSIYLGDELIASKILPYSLNYDSDQDLAFVFDEPITLEKDRKYKLVLDVARYANGRGYFQSDIRNALGDDGWYMKVGLIE